MKMKFTKALRDLTINPKRTYLVVFALFLGIWGVGTVMVSYYKLTKDLNTNFQKTSPAHLILKSDDFSNLNLARFTNKTEIETAEFRDFSFERIEVYPDVWIPMFLYGVESFENASVAKIFSQTGELSPKKGTISFERDGKNISNIDIGSAPRVRIGNKVINIPVSSICFDPAQAPATQDHMIYAYTDKDTYSEITGQETNRRLIIRLNDVYSQNDVKKVSEKLIKQFKKQEIYIDKVEILLFNEHPHQWQLNTILFVVGVIGLLAFLMGAVLVSQLMKSIMANQVRQIGIMKAIGSSRVQIFRIYITTLLLFGLFAGVLAVPLAVLAGSAYADFVGGILNFDILTSTPVSIYAALFTLSLLFPVLLSFSILLKGTKISVKDAFSDYGIENNSGVKQIKFFSKFSFSNTFLLAIRNSLRNSRRLTVVIISMALGVAVFNTGFNVRQSLWELLYNLQNELQYDVQVVLNKQISTEEAVKPFETLQNVKSISTWNGGSGMLQTKLLSTDKGAGIVTLPYDTKLIQPKIIEGNWLTNSSKLEVVLNQQAWELYGYKPLNSNLNLTIGDSTITAKLVGIVEQFELSKIYIDIDEYDNIFNPEHFINTITFEAINNDYEDVVALKKQIEKSILSSNLHVLFVMSDVERVKVIYDHMDIILSVIVFLSFLVLLVSAVGMASATGISITERTREIGVMRAIGGTPKKIYSAFVSEGMIISFISIIIGLILSYPLSKLASVFFGNLMIGEEAILEYAFSPLGFLITIGVTIIFGWLASRLPAGTALKKSTREALAYE